MSVTQTGAGVSAIGPTSGVSSWSTTISVPVGTQYLVIGEANADGSGGQTPPTVTYNGVSMSMIPSSSVIASFFETSLWVLNAPPSGANTLTITVNGGGGHNAGFLFAGAWFLAGVDTTTPYGTAAINSAIAVAGASVTATGGSSGDLYLGVAHVYGTAITSGSSPQTLVSKQQNIGGLTSASIDTIDGASAGAFTWSAGGTTNSGWTSSAVVFKAGAAATVNIEVENGARARPGRGPFSTRAKGFRVSNIDAFQNAIAAALQGAAIDVAQASGNLSTQPNIAQTDWGQSRNRPGRGPLSTGRFFLPSIDAFKTSQSAVLQGAAADVVNAAGALTTAILMAGSASDSATATANLSTAINLAVNAIATATASGALTTAILLSGSASDSVIATGALAGTAASLAGAATDVVTATGQLITGIPLSGSAQDVANATGALTTQIKLQAAAQAIATAAGNLTTQIQLVGAAIDTAIATGSITGGALLSGAAQAVAIAGGSLTTAIQLLGSAADQATAAGALSTGIKLSGSASDIVVATGSLAGNAAALVGAAQSIVTAIGILSTGIPLGGGAVVVASAQGSLLTSIQLLGAAQSAVIAHGALTTVALYYASALTLRVPRRDYTLSIQRRDFTVTLH